MSDNSVTSREQVREDGIFTDNYGGLNTTASGLNCPYEDSPLMYNVDVNVSGKVSKRKGTKHILTTGSTVNTGVGLVPFVTGLRYPFVIEKRGTGLYVYELNNDVATLVVTKSNVWSSVAATVRPTYAKTTEVEPRLIITTGVNQPVQLRFVEQQGIASGSGSNYALTGAERFEHASTSNIVVYKNRTRVTPSAVSYLTGTLTLTGVSYTSGDVIDVILITWQHMVEALRLTGDRVCGQATRYHVVKTDQNVEIPSSLRFDPLSDYPTYPYTYGYVAYKDDVWDINKSASGQYTYSTGLNPSTATTYAFGDGTRYVGGTGTVTPAPTFVTFGDIGSGDPTRVFIAKRIDLRQWFNGGTDQAASAYKVYIDDTLKTQHVSTAAGSSTFGDYYMVNNSNTVITSTSSTCRFITWEAGVQMGVAKTAVIKVINCSTSFIGSSATADVHLYKDGACEPLYGVGAFFDYYSGSFARNITIFQNRLVFSSIIANPLLLVISEVGDTVEPLRPYRDFQIESANTLATAPFDITIQGKSDDFVTGLIVWQGSLFVFSRQAVFRVAGASGSFSNISRDLRLISSLGLVNPYCLVSTESGILYLTDAGVYQLAVGVDSDDFSGAEVSIKIRSLFGITKNPTYESQPFMSYDTVNQIIYLGLPTTSSTSHCSKLYVFNTYRAAWTEYRTDGGFSFNYIVQVQDLTNGLLMLGYYYASSTSRYLIKFNDTSYVDFRKSYTGDGSTTVFTAVFSEPTMTTATVDNVYGYTCTPYFDMLENTKVEDVYVSLNGTRLVFGTDYIKRAGNQVYLLQNPGAGKTLTVYPRSFATDFDATQAYYDITSPIPRHVPIHVTVDHTIKIQDQDYTFTTPATVTFTTAPANNAVIDIGKMYKTYYKTSQLTLNNLPALKRVKHLYSYFDNELGLTQYGASDVNNSSGQAADEIVGRYKVRMNCSVAVEYDSEYGEDFQADVYGFYSLVFDDSLFDITPSQFQYRRFTLFKESLSGIGCTYAAVFFSYDEGSFTLAGWQITNRIGTEKHINFGG